MKRSHLLCLVLFLMMGILQAEAQYYMSYTTKTDRSKLMELAYGTANTSSGNLITLQKQTTYQTMDGFGYAITYSTCYNLMMMHPRDRHAFLMRTFSRETGYGVSYIRMSIGCSDFSSTEYSLCDTKGLSHFALHSDEVNYVVPVLKEILEINPDLKIIGSPWTCPRWMKVKNLSSLEAYNSWTSGQLNPAYYEDYAQYFVMFVQAMEAQGIPIYAVTPQNEPLNKGNSASLYMPWEDEAAFVSRLAPAFKQAGLKTKIYVFDHNFNYDNISDQVDYPVKVYEALPADLQGGELVAGSAWHSYGGNPSELDDIRAKAPRKEMIFTEASIGTWNDGRSLSGMVGDFNWSVLGTVNRYCSAFIVWNMMLDLKRGPNRSGGCTTCYGAVDIDESDYHTITANSHYYEIIHMSSVVRTGAVRIGYQSKVSGIQLACFQNPDDSYGVVLSNEGSSEKKVTLMASGAGYAAVTVPGKSLVSVLLSSDKRVPEMLIDSTPMQRVGIGRYTLTLDMEQGHTYATSFLPQDLTSWYVDPDFLQVDGNGNITLQALSGNFTLTADLNERSLVVTPKYQKMDATGQGNLYIIGASNSVGKPFYVSGADWKLVNAIPMAEIADKVYQVTLTVGEQISPSQVDFGIYGSNEEWTPQFMGRSGSTYRIHCSNTLFGMGTGLMNFTDGSIYKRSSGKLKEGVAYRFTVDLTGGVGAGELTIDQVQATGILPLSADPASASDAIYDLSGRRLPSLQRGINIVGDRKVLR